MRQIKKEKLAILILSCVVAIESILLVFFISRPKKIAVTPKELKGKIAIVIDDWGYNLNNLYLLDGVNFRFTASILPNLPYSKKAAQALHERGLEVILHLPMEPYEQYRLEKNTVMRQMDAEQVKKIIAEGLAGVPFAKGVSNHMGSRATEDSRLMEIIFKELKRRRLYFLDSFVTEKSLCAALAHKTGLKFVRRDVFLDNQETPGYIRQQLYRLKARARANGSAVGIGHDRKATLGVLKEELPALEKEGYKFVFVSELLK